MGSKWLRILCNDSVWYFVVCQLELLLLIAVWCDLKVGDSITRKGFWQVWEHSCYPANLQESAVLEAQCQDGDRQGATSVVLPSKPASDSWQIPPEQGTGPRTGCTHGSGELNVSSFIYVLHITIEQGWSQHGSRTICLPHAGPYLHTGPWGPGPGQQIFRGGILKKSRLKYGMREKKAVHEREI